MKRTIWLTIALLAICVVYSNSFENAFHFDDFHTVVNNPAVRSLKNVPRFFTDATMFSVLPANRTYRPLVSTSLALDYALGHGYIPFWFHLSTFEFFLGEVWLLFALYKLLLNKLWPGPANEWIALFGAAWFGLHPAIAETVNYVIQRGDLYCTMGCVTALYLFARYPGQRRAGVYLLPFAAALLSKPPAAVFPVLLMLYFYFFEAADDAPLRRVTRGLVAAVPSIVVMIALLLLQSTMTPKSFTPSIISPGEYRLAQPYVWARYVGELFFPLHLNVDTDLTAFSKLDARACVGLAFLAVMLVAIWFTARRRRLYPIAFGLLWFVVTQLPTSLYPLSEVENDHRMFFSFAGLILAVIWAAWLLIERVAGTQLWEGGRGKNLRMGLAGVAVLMLAAYGYGASRRNVVWRTEDSLWKDDVEKSPHNGRGLMIYGLTLMNKGDYPATLEMFNKALLYTPNYSTLEINLGVVNGLMADQGNVAQSAEAERHFQRAIALDINDDRGYAYYGRWLGQHGRFAEAIAQLQRAIALDPPQPFQHEVLIDTYSREGDLDGARKAAQETLALIPDDVTALQSLQQPAGQTAAYWINLSLAQSKEGLNEQSITSARKALALDPKSAVAYVNIGAGYGAMDQWDEAIKNEQEALRLQPDLQIAKNNLALYMQQKANNGKIEPAKANESDLINESLRLNKAGQFEASIAAAEKVLAIDPKSAIAWNNISAANEAMHRWDKAIDAAQKALALQPDLQIAKNNLAWSLSQKKANVH